ncbi:MAG: NAD(P)-binding protein [Myxococcales bacterium]|nr:NAD(P)-binding protein [Myxococcales bacterium]
MEALELMARLPTASSGGPSRRDVLAAGLASLSAGCLPRRDPGLGHIRGEILGPSDGRGHSLRDGGEGLRGRAIAEQERVDVAILGGGVAGLSAAWRLSRAGLDHFRVLELEDELGGTSRPGENHVTTYPWGAHYLPVPSRNLDALCELLRELDILRGFDAGGRALCREETLCRAPQERVFFKGRWYEGLYLRVGASAEDQRQFERFHDEVSRWVKAVSSDGRRAFSLPRAHSAPEVAAELDQLTMATYLDRLGLSSWRLRWYVDYACRDDFGLRATQCSAWAGMHYFAARLLHGDDSPPEVLTWPEGNGYLVRRLAQHVGDESASRRGRLRPRSLVVDVRALPNAGPGADTVEVLYLDLSQDPDPRKAPLCSLRARRAIWALPAFLRRHVLADYRQRPDSVPAWLQQFTYAPWLVANLTLRRAHAAPVAAAPVSVSARGAGFPPCWDNVLIESPSLGYVVATHQREAPIVPRSQGGDGQPRTVWTYYLPLSDGDPKDERARLLKLSWADARDRVLADLGRAEPTVRRDTERIDFFRWGHGMVRPVPGLLTGAALAQAALPRGGVHFAHSDLSGMALFEEAHHAGVRAAEEVLTALDASFEPWA